MGVIIGASVISFIEFIQFIIELIGLRFCFRKRKNETGCELNHLNEKENGNDAKNMRLDALIFFRLNDVTRPDL